MLYGSITDLKRKLQGGVRGVDYFLYMDSTSSFLKNLVGFNPINIAEFTALSLTLDTLKKADEFILCKSMPVPASNLNVVEVEYKGHNFKLPSNRTYDPVDMTFFNTPSQHLYDFFIAWQHLASNFLAPDGTSSYSSGDAVSCNILQVQTDSTRKIIGAWLLLNAWVSNVSNVDFSAENNDLTEFTVTFQIEKAIRVPVASLDTVKVVGGIFGVNVADVVSSLQRTVA
jgi:hypothetical protein